MHKHIRVYAVINWANGHAAQCWRHRWKRPNGTVNDVIVNAGVAAALYNRLFKPNCWIWTKLCTSVTKCMFLFYRNHNVFSVFLLLSFYFRHVLPAVITLILLWRMRIDDGTLFLYVIVDDHVTQSTDIPLNSGWRYSNIQFISISLQRILCVYLEAWKINFRYQPLSIMINWSILMRHLPTIL